MAALSGWLISSNLSISTITLAIFIWFRLSIWQKIFLLIGRWRWPMWQRTFIALH
ncbi:MAG TPA: hypothetical protein DEQ25_04165 [Methylophaga sp.]|nr:hypothetical protein [Methylophaga sp.]